MRIIRGFPPNYADIRAAFPIAGRPGVMFTWGDAIYVPSGNKPPPSLMVHEQVHCGRQGSDPAGWWREYIDDAEFRLAEELPAHRAEARWFFSSSDKAKRTALRAIAERLASPLYGSMLSICKAQELLAGSTDECPAQAM